MSEINNINNTYLSENINNILPPPPPSRHPIILPDYPIQPGFGFITDNSTRKMVLSAYKAISRAESWSILRNFTEHSFMNSLDPQITNLIAIVANEYNDGHSGSSMGCTMRHMEYIAKNGFSNYRDYMMESRREVVRQPLNVRILETRNISSVLPQ